jgi:hypothetical protein
MTSREAELTKICDPNDVSSVTASTTEVNEKSVITRKMKHDLHEMERIVRNPGTGLFECIDANGMYIFR